MGKPFHKLFSETNLNWKWSVFFFTCGVVWGADAATHPDLTIRTVITSKMYCLGQPGYIFPKRQSRGAITLRLNIRLFYRNVGSSPIILPYGPNLSRLFVRTLNETRQSQAIVRGLPSLPLLDATAMDTPSPSLFQIVQPGEESTVPTSQYAVLPVHDPSAGNRKTEFLGRKISIELEINHDRFPKRQVKELASKWKQIGLLWAVTVRTEPIQIDIPPSPEINDCSHEFRVD